MYGEFAKVAEKNRYAWSYGSPTETEKSIGAVTKKNRMICLPCEWYSVAKTCLLSLFLTYIDPLLMNAFNTINLAGACVLTSAEHARELRIPSDRYIYPLGGAGTRDSNDCKLTPISSQMVNLLTTFRAKVWERPEFWWSPAISRSLDAGLEASGLDKEDIDLYDFYS